MASLYVAIAADRAMAVGQTKPQIVIVYPKKSVIQESPVVNFDPVRPLPKSLGESVYQ